MNISVNQSIAFCALTTVLHLLPLALRLTRLPVHYLSGLQQHWGCFHSSGIVLPAWNTPSFPGKTFLNIPFLSGTFEPTKSFFEWIVYSPKITEFNLIYQAALNLFSSEGERRGCYYFTIWKRRYLSSPGQIYTNWFMKIQVAISQHHREILKDDFSSWMDFAMSQCIVVTQVLYELTWHLFMEGNIISYKA